MQESGEDFGEQDEDTEIQNLPLYTERKADGIYRYRRRVPKNLVERIGKGYLYRNLGRTKKDVVGNWPEAHAEVEAILDGAQASAEKSAELIKRKDHRATILHLVEEEYGKEAAQRLEVGAVDDNLEYALMALADRLRACIQRKPSHCCMGLSCQNALLALLMSWTSTPSLKQQGMKQQTTD
jgi:hypothetical protein